MAKDFQDDKYYDLDDDWIDDGDIDIQEDLGDELHLGEGASLLFTEQQANEQSSTLRNILGNAEGEEQEARLFSRRQKKD